MSLYGKEKIWFLVNRLLDEREVTSAGQPVALHPANDLNKHYLPMDLINLSAKLEKEHNAVKLLNAAPTDQTYGKYLFELLPDFDNYVLELRKDPKYLDWMGEKPEPAPKSDAKKDETNDELILFLAVIAQAFTDSKNEPISLSLADFEPLSFKMLNEFVDHLAGSKTFGVTSRPLTAKDKTPYRLSLSQKQKNDYTKIKESFEQKRDLQMLMIYWSKICNIYDVIAGGYVGWEDPQLNRSYVMLTIKVEDILAKQGFEDLREKQPFIYETLLGNYEDLDISWEFMRPTLMEYYGILEKKWLREAPGNFELKEDEQKLLDDSDKAINEHSQRKKRLDENFEKRLEQDALKMREQMLGKDNAAAKSTEQSNQTASPDKPSKTDDTSTATKATPKKIEVHSLQPSHYSSRTGVLSLSPHEKVAVARKGNVKRKNGKKYDQCWLLECLFKTVNTLKLGVNFSTVLGVNKAKIGKKELKKIRNTVDEINEKIADVGGPKSLIKIQAGKVFVNSSYL